ncbi:MAG TPA: glycogen debranching N-terminal domain-containing protein [Xanthobacteraceae bacterium]|jgi:glycogen debranching enzyme
MTRELTAGPLHLVINQGHTVLVADRDGQMPWPGKTGLYFYDTRIISSWQLYANGEPWDLLGAANISHYAARVFLINRTIPSEQSMIPAGTIGLALSRSVGGGVHEDIDVVNHGMKPVRFNIEIAIRCDFADLFEVKAGKIVRRGRITTEWSAANKRLRTLYRNRDFCREATVVVRRDDSPPVYANGRLSFELSLQPGAAWHACLLYEPGDGKVRLEAPAECIERARGSTVGQRLDEWQRTVLKIRTGNQEIYRLFHQAIADMSALRLPSDASDQLQFVPAAGVPWFVALFGRDTLIASVQSAIVYPEFATATLDALAFWQASERDDYRDAEPGKIMHELRLGELAHFKLIPHTPYYGTADATMLFLILLHTAWRATGGAALLKRHLRTAERCLDWIDRYGDRDGDGFQEYATRSSAGYENQGWKDAGDAVLDPDGSAVKSPKALCELQGYVYDAWLRMAEIFDALDKPDRAQSLRDKAASLFQRFNDAFWDESSGFYAYALDGNKQKVLTVTSNPGHCLWSGIVPPDRAGRTARRLLAPDMWSGWGIRTLSADHPAYNPYSYQNGSVWPHDNGIIALGFRRYGLAAEAAQIARAVSDAAGYLQRYQLPELYSGVARAVSDFPVQYPDANAPQAWAAGSVFSFLQAMLGIQPDAPRERLYLDPALPDWLSDITLCELRVGERKFDIRFWREGQHTRWDVLAGDGELVSHRTFCSGPLLPGAPSWS